MSSITSVAGAAAELASTFAGQLLKPADVGYDDARKVHNGLIDKRPALIARCRGVADVVDAINLARRLGLEVAVRGGGHNVAGRATIDGGVMIDLSPMKVVHVDPNDRTVEAQGGVTWSELNRETQRHALAVTGGVVSTTGIAGLTLGGGLGWLMGKYGLALDNLRAVELVTANGMVVRASRDEEPDLFWAVRGGGGNFGVVTSFEYQLHRVGPNVTAGLIVHPIDRARDLLEFYRKSTQSLSDEHTLFATLTHSPDGTGTQVAALVTCDCGSLAEAEKAVQPLKQFGSPVLDAVGPMPYCQLNSMLDAGFPKGALNYWKSSFLTHLSDGAHRGEGYNFLVLAQWMQPADTRACVAWARETYERMQPFFASGRYVNYLDDDEAGDPVAAAYGPNYRRLQQIKTKYDPKNFFRMNHNIRPFA